MYYQQTIVPSKKGYRLQSIEQLKKLAQWITQQTGLEAHVFSNAIGDAYRNHLLIKLDHLKQQTIMNPDLLQSDFAQQWFQDSEEMMRWEESVNYFYEISQPKTISKPFVFASATQLRLKVGMAQAGLNHLKKLASQVESEYQISCEVAGNVGGDPYLHAVIARYETLDDFEKLMRETSTEWYANWFQEAMEEIDMNSMEINLFHHMQ